MIKFTSHQKRLLTYCALLVTCAPFSIDMYLASIPTIAQYFHSSHAQVQLTLSCYLISYALGQLFWGPLSDRIGRKNVIFTGITLFVIGSIFCALSPSITFLIVMRMLQGFGACAGIVMALAISKDTFTNHDAMTKAISIIMSITLLAPAIAPTIGSYLLVHLGWQSNFYFMTIYGILIFLLSLFIKESYPRDQRKPLPIKKLLYSYAQQISYKPYLLMMIAASCNFAALFSFISASPYIYLKIYHLSPHLFGYYFAINALALALGSISLNYLKPLLGEKKLFLLALMICFSGTILMIASTDLDSSTIWSVTLPAGIITYGIGILFPGTMALALQNVVQYTGVASCLIGTSRCILGGFIVYLMGHIIHTTALPLAVVMLVLCSLSGILLLTYFKVIKTYQKTGK